METVIAMKREGFTARAIAGHLGISEQAVSNYVKRARASGDLPYGPVHPAEMTAMRLASWHRRFTLDEQAAANVTGKALLRIADEDTGREQS